MIVLVILALSADQILKHWARTVLAPLGSIDIIKDFFKLTYVENRGGAFGIMQGKTFVFVTAVFLVIAFMYSQRELIKNDNIIRISCIFLLTGAVANLTDRLLFGFVTDMFDFYGIWKFVFNLADIYVVVSTFLIAYRIIKTE